MNEEDLKMIDNTNNVISAAASSLKDSDDFLGIRGNKYKAIGKAMSRVSTPLGYGIAGYDIYRGIKKDGGHFGPNAQKATNSSIGAIGGAMLGARIGASLGPAGIFFGSIIGGFLGGLL